MSITKSIFGIMPDSKDVELYSLVNAAGMRADLITYGATLVRLYTPGKDGSLQDVVLGYDTLEGYLEGGNFHGALIGRYANRIAGGKFTLGGREYDLTKNEKGVTTLHGGKGFDKKVWRVDGTNDSEEPSVTFACFSADGEEGFPGNLQAKVTYTVTKENALKIDYEAKSDAETPINLTNHAYFNLGGFDGGDVLSQILTIHADGYTPADTLSIPTGEIAPVAGTPMDFTSPKPVGQNIDADFEQLKNAQGYDHNYVLRGSGMKLAAEVYDPKTGRVMQTYTDKPGVQLYTANFLDGINVGKGGLPMKRRHALCLETQFFPDSVNRPGFPSPFFKAGQQYRYTTIYQFSVK